MNDPGASPQRPDASMSLLVDLSASSLDPGYAEAAARRSVAPSAGASRHPLALLGGLLLVALILAAAAIQAHARAPETVRARSALAAQVEQQSRAVDALTAQVTQLRAQTEALRDKALAGSAAGSALADQLRAGELAAGVVAVTGPGLRVTLNDAAGGGATRNRVQDRDLQAVVNALWAAGAEAIAVNGRRLTAQSAIRAAGDAILVDFAPVDPPYVVDAVGDAVAVETAFAASPAADRVRGYVQLYGLRFGYARERVLRLPAAAEEPLRYARPVPSPSPAPTRRSTSP